MVATIVLQNSRPLDYYTGYEVPEQGTLGCEGPSTEVTAFCPLGPLTLSCNASGIIHYNCSTLSFVPTCSLLESSSMSSSFDSIVKSASCEVESYTATNTTCKCSVASTSSGPGRRRLDSLTESTVNIALYSSTSSVSMPASSTFVAQEPTAAPTYAPTSQPTIQEKHNEK